jgi:hypothetical protein
LILTAGCFRFLNLVGITAEQETNAAIEEAMAMPKSGPCAELARATAVTREKATIARKPHRRPK